MRNRPQDIFQTESNVIILILCSVFVTCRNVGAMEVFALPKDKRALVAGVLLSAVKIERVEKQVCYWF